MTDQHTTLTTTGIDRTRLIATLRNALAQHPQVCAAWEGGSAAFTYMDELSDVDAVVVVEDDAVAAVFDAVEAALQALSPIDLRHDITGTVGYQQRFYRLRDASPFLVVDLVLMRRGDPLLFREVELHGNGTTWLDRYALLKPKHLDVESDLAQAKARLPALKSAFDMFQHIPTKERLRGRAVEALSFYHAMTVRPLVELLRIQHCPHLRGFGLRYLDRDLPPDVVARIQQLMFVSDLADLERKHAEAQAWFWDTVRQMA